MKTRFLFILALIFAVAAIARPGASVHADMEDSGYAVACDSPSHSFCQGELPSRGEPEPPAMASGNFGASYKDFQRKDGKSNLKYNSQTGPEPPSGVPGSAALAGGAAYLIPDISSGIGLLHCLGRLNI